MNCSDFQRRLLIDPRSPELAEAAQARVCDDAATRLTEALAFEHYVEAALAVAVPSNLADRVLAALPADDLPARRSTALRWPLALAASLALIALVTTSVVRAPNATHSLIAASVEHLSHEPYALTRSAVVPQTLVDRMFTEAGLKLNSSALALSYLNRCPLKQGLSLHMVMPAPEGPVTVMYVPGEQKVERMDTRLDMVAVRTLPFANGAMVFLAESNRDFDRIENAWHQATGEALALAAGSD